MHPLDRFFRFVLPIGAITVITTVVGVGWVAQPDRYSRGYAPEQPIAFSHALHGGTLKIPCAYCHSGASRSRAAGIPSVETCMGCHRVTKTDSPEIQKLAAIYESGKPLEWRRVHELPDHAFFDHRPHVNAGIACQSCHGEVQTMKVVSREMSLRMGSCLACHRDPHEALPKDTTIKSGPDNCAACHR